MSPINSLGVLAFASAVLAVPHAHAHEHNHRHLHERRDVSAVTGSVPSLPSTPSVGGLLSGKKGIAYNDPSAAVPFASAAGFGWAFNWVSNSAGLSGDVSYIPTLHNGEQEFLSSWHSDAQAAISGGAKYLFGFNEPDIASQANLDPQTAASLWKQYMEPYAGQATLVAPAVSNSGNPGEGLDWLSQFMSACSDCTIGAVNQHWYDSTGNDMSLFQQQISAAHTQTGLPVFVGEFGFIGSDSDISSAISQAMSWMDSQDSIIGYAYFMAASGYLLDGSTPSPYGLTYIGS